jgi:hypothetical protein
LAQHALDGAAPHELVHNDDNARDLARVEAKTPGVEQCRSDLGAPLIEPIIWAYRRVPK